MTPDGRRQDELQALAARLAGTTTFAEAAELIATWARDLTGAEAVTLRLAHPADTEAWLHVCGHLGLDFGFLRDEATIPWGDCICGSVVAGNVQKAPFYTTGGAFSWGRVQSLLEEFADYELGSLRGRCIEEGFDSVSVIPLVAGNEPVGVLHLADHRPELFDPHLEVLEAAGRLAGEVMAEHRGPETEAAARSFLQAALLPPHPPEVPGLELAASFITASTFAQMGGDFYDVVPRHDGRVMLLVGDYSGRGMQAAGLASETRRLLSDLATRSSSPADLLTEANRLLAVEQDPSRFLTAAACLLEPASGRLELSLAGHPPPVVLDEKEPAQLLEMVAPFHPPLGIENHVNYRQREDRLGKNQILLLYTDGVTEARREGVLFGIEGIAEACRASELTVPNLTAGICARSSEFHDPDLPPDDRLVLAVRRNA
ncbi:MAG: hypothetical protein Kow00129_09940 [Thermoleophilia bacterium]